MTQQTYEGTPQQLAAWLGQLPGEKRYRLSIEEKETDAEAAQPEDIVAAKLRQWQAQDSKSLMPDIPTHTLFAQWAEEDAQMTDDEREAEDRLWEDVQKGINETRATLGMRCL